ncbi:FtsB family cell division protein [Rhodothalassium salexigens]|uniref:FtsB family cell division protein n=1 Tax=Rhodothalassium salexigens TaxID=1086 RepID=UPI0019149AFF|nr:septum formation initiator family protein [Rhodothalassium salexigens]
MMRLRSINPRLVRALPAAVALLVLAYFGYHALHGKYGFFAYSRLVDEHAQLSAEARRLMAERRALEAQVSLMRPDRLDADWLDEEARRSLGYLHPQDVVVIER